jgi:hypothetical protein
MIQLCKVEGLEHAKPLYWIDNEGWIVEKDSSEMERAVCELEGYENVAPYIYITSQGRVLSKHAGVKPLKVQVDNDGYERIRLSTTSGNRKSARVHRLVALAFIQNPHPDTYLTVDHIDRNTRNNTMSNLRWADARIQALNSSRSKAVLQCLEDGFVIKTWYSLTELASAFGEDDPKEVKRALDKKILYHGFRLEYAKDTLGVG